MSEQINDILLAFIIIGLPILLIFGRPILKRVLEHREKRMEIDARIAAEQAVRHTAQSERLEQRVRVLERIVTDKGIVVAEEIERLRDAPLN
jgi:hypothetical protein